MTLRRLSSLPLLIPTLLLGCGGTDTTSGSGTTTDTTTTTTSTSTLPAECKRPGSDAPPPDPARHTPRWAFEPWISKDISTGADTYDFVKGFQDRDIPVGAVVLDSPWETNYNTFVPNPSRYPDFAGMVSDLHDQDIRVVLWITQMVNSTSYDLEPGGDAYMSPSPNQEQGYTCNYYVNDGEEYNWWKGKGAAVDFFNPDAAAWWHEQQDTVLDAGIDGWKLDFGDSYIPTETVKTFDGDKPHQDYSTAYYRDYLSYGVQKRGPEFLTMVRAWDESYGFAGRFYAKPEHAPVCWMGDNRRDWVGVVDVLDSMFRSAEGGYVVLGSDIGGYLDRDDKDLTGDTIPLDPMVFMKWTALSGLSPFMQLHGRANLTPWTFPEQTDDVVKVYRYWAKLHHQLAPFFYSVAEWTYQNGGKGIVQPIGAEAEWAGDYRFTLGDALFVAPILDGTGVRDISLPSGPHYYDWWAPDTDPLQGGQKLLDYDATAPERYPLFVRSGAIIPLQDADEVTGLGTAASKGKLTVLVYPAVTSSTEFELLDADEAWTKITEEKVNLGVKVTFDRVLADTLVRIRAEVPPAAVQVDGASVPELADRAAFDAATTGWFSEPSTRSVWVHVPKGAGSHTIESQ